MKYLFTALCLIITFSVSAQKTTLYFNDNGDKVANKALAKTYREITTTDSIIANVKSFTLAGKIQYDYNFSDLRKFRHDGVCRDWFENGQLKWERTYKEGKLDGSLKTFYKSGQKRRDDNYSQDQLLKGQCFTKAGLDTVYFPFEVQPEFPNGEQAMYKYIAKEVYYPKAARKDKIEGLVVVSFVVDEYGVITEPKILKSLRADVDEVAIDMVNRMPTWQPGQADGEKVKVKYTLPLRFRL